MKIALNTPYVEHSKNSLAVEPTNLPPVYEPQVVVRAILHAATHPVREIYAGGFAKVTAISGTFAPRTTDAVMKRTMFNGQKKHQPRQRDGDGALYAPGSDGRVRGDYTGRVLRHSLYTRFAMNPVRSALLALVMGGAALAASLRRRRIAGL